MDKTIFFIVFTFIIITQTAMCANENKYGVAECMAKIIELLKLPEKKPECVTDEKLKEAGIHLKTLQNLAAKVTKCGRSGKLSTAYQCVFQGTARILQNPSFRALLQVFTDSGKNCFGKLKTALTGTCL